MTSTTLTPAALALRPPRSHGLVRRFGDVIVLTGRNLLHIAREPLQLSDVTIQPVLFTLLFVYVFGSGVVLPGGGSYTDFAIAGLLALNLTTSAMGTAVGLSTDLNSASSTASGPFPCGEPPCSSGDPSPTCRPPPCAP
jgi:ABC-2 type transport system permease protein